MSSSEHGYQPPQAIGQIAIIVQDLDRAVQFYRDILGLPFLFAAPPSLAFFQCGGIRLMLTPPEGASASHASIVYYRVTDLALSHTTLTERGAVFDDAPHLIARMPDHELWMTFLKDSEGNTLGLMQERLRADG